MSAGEVTEDSVLERERELEAIRTALDAARGGQGKLVLVDGPAGVGKTTLMKWARETAADAGMRLLSARGNELERPFGFGVVRQLFEPALMNPQGDVAELLSGAARFVPSVLDIEPLAKPEEAPRDTFAIQNGIYWLTANLAERQPLAMLVDDLHWSDDESVEALAHLGNRLEGLPVALILASRIEESRSGLEALRRSASELGRRLRPRSLGREAVAAVVRSSVPDATAALCDGCLEASGGNPFLLKELVRSLSEGGAADPAAVLDGSPERVTREMNARLERLPKSAEALARAGAVLGDGTPLRRAAALAGLGAEEAAEGADSLVAAGILQQASPLEFLHPLVRAGLYAGIGPAARSVEHARAARLIAEEAEPATRVATQLLRCDPAGDPWALEVLLEAAAHAIARGAPEAAAALLTRALAEPPPPETRSNVLLELGTAEVAAGETDAALKHVREAMAGTIGPDDRVRGVVLLAGMLAHAGRVPEAVDVLEEQLHALASRPDLLTQVQVAIANLTQYEPGAHERTLDIRSAFDERTTAGDESDPGVLASVAGDTLFACGDRSRAVDLAKRSAASESRETTYSALGWSRLFVMRCLTMTEDFDAARAVAEQGLEKAQTIGASLDYAGWHCMRAELDHRVGDLPAAEVDARTALDVGRAAGWLNAANLVVAFLGEILVDRGEIGEAATLIDELDESRDLSGGYPAANLWFARARCRMAQGRTEDAVDDFREAGRRLSAFGAINPAVVPWRSHLALALLEVDQAVEASRLAAEELELARAFGAPRALSVSLRGMARVQSGNEEIGLLGEAAEVIEDSPAQLERARVHYQLGVALRRERSRPDAAREPLRLAVDLAHRCGAHALEDEALDELRATGARPRRRLATGAGALTPSERRIAELAAAGRQNREIAESLFVTVDTVEFHLRNGYRKLGISGRDELPEQLSDAQDGGSR
jgi:ATP/maltotriose-dependent transcriptional regulator MalT